VARGKIDDADRYSMTMLCPLHIAAFAQPLPKSVDNRAPFGRFKRAGHQVADAREFRSLLRARRERPSRGAAEKRDEGAPV